MTFAWLVFVLGMGMGMVADAPLAEIVRDPVAGASVSSIACWGTGSVLGTLFGRWMERPHGAALDGVRGGRRGHLGLRGRPLRPGSRSVLVSLLVMGTSDGISIVAENGIMQRRTPDAVRSRTMAALEAVLSLGLAVRLPGRGTGAPRGGARRLVYVIAGVFALGATIVLLPSASGPTKVGRVAQKGYCRNRLPRTARLCDSCSRWRRAAARRHDLALARRKPCGVPSLRAGPRDTGRLIDGRLDRVADGRGTAQGGPGGRIAGLVLIAPAPDFTSRADRAEAHRKQRKALAEMAISRSRRPIPPSRTSTRKALFDDGGANRVLTGPIDTHCPVHILQGLADPDVPADHALKLASHLPADDLTVSLMPDGDHRLSRPQDLEMIVSAVAAMAGVDAPDHAAVDPRLGVRRGDRRLWRHAGADHRRRQCGRRDARPDRKLGDGDLPRHGGGDRVAALAHADAGDRGVVDAGRCAGRGERGFTMSDAVGAFIVVALLLILTGVLKPLTRLISRIPASVASGMLAGIVVSFAINAVKTSPVDPVLILPLIAAFFLIRLFNPALSVLAVLIGGGAGGVPARPRRRRCRRRNCRRLCWSPRLLGVGRSSAWRCRSIWSPWPRRTCPAWPC